MPSGDGSGVTMNMDEWGNFVECVAEPVIKEINKSDPYIYDLEISDYAMLYLHTGKRYHSKGSLQLFWL